MRKMQMVAQASEAELRRRLAGLLLGDEMARKVYGKLAMHNEPIEVTLKVQKIQKPANQGGSFFVLPGGLEPSLPASEASALSTELREQRQNFTIDEGQCAHDVSARPAS